MHTAHTHRTPLYRPHCLQWTECDILVDSYSATAPVRLEMTIPIVVHGDVTSDQARARLCVPQGSVGC